MHFPAQDGATLGISGTGLVPAYRFGLSLNNPSTWNRFMFSTLSSAYSGLRVDQLSSSVRNEISGLDRLQFIIPIKGKYGFGLGIKPYSQQKFSFTYESGSMILDQDTLTLSKEFSGRGGISSLYTGISFPISEKDQVGIKFDFLFGSSRFTNNLLIDSDRFQTNSRHFYSGTVLNVYLSSNRFKLFNKEIHTFASAGLTLSPLTVHKTTNQLYQDINNNGIYDIYDFPDSVSEEISTTLNAYSPQEFGFGFDIGITESVHLLSEVYVWKNGANVTADFSILDDHIKQWTHMNVSLVSFASPTPKVWYETFHFRTGAYTRKDEFLNNQNSVIELGASLGFGINFGFPVNQIDIALMAGERQMGSTKTESIRRLTVSVNLTDIWFIKRRHRN
jgi:hypothetical protein